MCVHIVQINAQVSGNVNYLKASTYTPPSQVDLSNPTSPQIYISVKGLANVKADAYVAVFSLTQVGDSAEDVNELMEQRITAIKKEIGVKPGVEMYVDMLSFVPVYELTDEKKVFSKKTHNEIPAGFEMKKNLHLKYTNPNQLNDFITIMSRHEVYDLIKVDYFSNALENIKKELMQKAKLRIDEKTKNMESLTGVSFSPDQKFVLDEYKVVMPVDMYQSFQAYSSSYLTVKKSATVNRVAKPTTLYYQPIAAEDFDFVINPVVLEPVIQVMYEVRIVVNRSYPVVKTEPIQKPEKEYVIISPTGDLKTLSLKP